jgi:hypothetical protein
MQQSKFFKGLTCFVAAAWIAAIFAVTGGCKKSPDPVATNASGGAARGNGTASGGTTATAPAATSNAYPQSPKAVRLAFSRAMAAGDVAKARSLSTGDAGPEMLDSLAKLALATDQLQRGLKAKFGDKATKLEIFTESPDPEIELNQSTETITGDTADVRLSPTDKNPSKFKRIDGQWKFDVTMFKESASMAPQLRKMAAVWSDLAAEVNAGKYATVDDFSKAYTARTAAAAGG